MTDTAADPRTRDACAAADARDALATFRDEFDLPDGIIYLDGNSLGALPRAAAARAADVIATQWGRDLIGSWNTHGWFDLPVRLGAKLSTIVGGERGAAVATDTTSVNVFKAVAAALRIQQDDAPHRRTIVAERGSFPTDLYMVDGLIRLRDRGYRLRLVDGSTTLPEALDDDVAVVLLSHVDYRTGRMWDLPAVTADVHAAGALVVWDLCHSVGAVPVELDAADADFAVGCTYKYLNGGPGSPAFVWVSGRHLGRARQPLSGWWGHARPFDMAVDYAPADGIRRFLAGTQPIVSLATMEVGLDIALRADIRAVREKSLALTSLFIALVEHRLARHPLTLVTPRDPGGRGSHVSFRHPQGYAVMKALIARGVVGDYREPEVLRFGVTPLYTRHVDVWDAVEALRVVLDDELWRAPEFHVRDTVT